MVIHDLDIKGISIHPAKADPTLVINTDDVLPLAVALQGLDPVAGRGPQILKCPTPRYFRHHPQR
jgi:hypothetical protein